MTGSDLSILIIDDNPAEIELLKESFYIECPGMRLRHLASIDEAMALIRSLLPEHVPDAVLVDYRLPRSSGVDVIHELVKYPHWATVPRMVMTGSVDPYLIEHCRRAGADEIFVKPSEFNGYLQFAKELTTRLRKAQSKPSLP